MSIQVGKVSLIVILNVISSIDIAGGAQPPPWYWRWLGPPLFRTAGTSPVSPQRKGKPPRHIFTRDDDEKIRALMEQYDGDRAQVARDMGLTQRQIRERWNSINNQVHVTWTTREEEALTGLVLTHGHSWTNIARIMFGETDSARLSSLALNCKNRWNSMKPGRPTKRRKSRNHTATEAPIRDAGIEQGTDELEKLRRDFYLAQLPMPPPPPPGP